MMFALLIVAVLKLDVTILLFIVPLKTAILLNVIQKMDVSTLLLFVMTMIPVLPTIVILKLEIVFILLSSVMTIILVLTMPV